MPNPHTKVPDPPKKPKIRTIESVLTSMAPVPYWISGDPYLLNEEGETDYQSPGQVAICVRPFSLRDTLIYTQELGRSFHRDIQSYITALVHLSMLDIEQNNALESGDMSRLQEVASGLTQDEHGNVVTVTGTLMGDLINHTNVIGSWILARCGKIVRKTGPLTYETEPIALEKVQELLPMGYFTTILDEGLPMFTALLSDIGMYQPKIVREEEEADPNSTASVGNDSDSE